MEQPQCRAALGAGGAVKHIFPERELLKLEVMEPEKQPTWAGPRGLQVQGQNRLGLVGKQSPGPTKPTEPTPR